MTEESVQALPTVVEEPHAQLEAPDLLRTYAVQTLTPRLTKMLSFAEGVHQEDMEAIRQMRVWSRRSRAALDIFGVCFAEKPYTALAKEVKAVTRALGTARDLDVMGGRLAVMQGELPPEQQSGLAYAIETLLEQRQQAQPAVIQALEHLTQFDLMSRWKALQVLPAHALKTKRARSASRPQLLTPTDTLVVNGARVLLLRIEGLLSYAPSLTDAKRVPEHHEMRIAAKRLRYTLEIFKEAFEAHPCSEVLSDLLQDVRALQEYLGDIHDADVLVPQLVAPMRQLLETGYGALPSGELPVGTERVDFSGLLGLLSVCKSSSAWREQRFGELQLFWNTLTESHRLEQVQTALESIGKGDN